MWILSLRMYERSSSACNGSRFVGLRLSFRMHTRSSSMVDLKEIQKKQPSLHTHTRSSSVSRKSRHNEFGPSLHTHTRSSSIFKPTSNVRKKPLASYAYAKLFGKTAQPCHPVFVHLAHACDYQSINYLVYIVMKRFRLPFSLAIRCANITGIPRSLMLRTTMGASLPPYLYSFFIAICSILIAAFTSLS